MLLSTIEGTSRSAALPASASETFNIRIGSTRAAFFGFCNPCFNFSTSDSPARATPASIIQAMMRPAMRIRVLRAAMFVPPKRSLSGCRRYLTRRSSPSPGARVRRNSVCSSAFSSTNGRHLPVLRSINSREVFSSLKRKVNSRVLSTAWFTGIR